MNPNDYVNCCVMVIYCCIWFEHKKSVVRDFKGEGLNILKHLYLNDYSEFDSKL